MESYLKFIAKSFQQQITYKVEYFVGLINGFLYVFVFTSLWKAIYNSYDQNLPDNPFTKTTIISYAVFAMVIKISFTMDDQITTRKIRTGALVTDLIKPINYFYLTLSECIGQSLFNAFARALPILIITIFTFDITAPQGVSNYILLFISATMGYLILFMINYIIGLLAFWFIDTFSFQLMKYGLYALLSGGIIPIDFFPSQAQSIINFLPFKYILYIPTSILLGRFEPHVITTALIGQLLWVILLLFTSKITWNKAMEKLVIQGG